MQQQKIAQNQKIAADLFAQLSPEFLQTLAQSTDYTKYQQDPAGFCREVLREELTDDVVRMMESVRDNMITVAISANATGKTHGAARVATWFYKAHQECKVFTAAAPPLDNLKNLLWGEIGSIAHRNPALFAGDTITSMDIRRASEEYLIGVTIPSSGTDQEKEAKFSGKHQEHMLFIFDEGDALPDCVYRGTESCMSGGHVRMLIMFNPRQTSGAVYRMVRDRQANIVYLSAFNHPNVITGTDVIPGAVNRDTTVRRINEWARPFVPGEKVESESLFDLPEFLNHAIAERKGGGFYPPLQPGQYVIVNPALAYMVLGRYPAQGSNQLISREWVSRARSRHDAYVSQFGDIPPVGSEGIMGLDCAEFGNDYNAAVARYGGYVTALKPERDLWGGIDMIETGLRAAQWYKSHDRVTSARVDATGVGSGVAPHMQTLGCVAIGVKGACSPTIAIDIGEFRHLRDQLWWQLREWLRADNSAMLPPDEELIEELLTPIYEIKEGKIVVSSQDDLKEILGRSPNKADALRQTFAGAGQFFDDVIYADEPRRTVGHGD